jgi:hypothetical protein
MQVKTPENLKEIRIGGVAGAMIGFALSYSMFIFHFVGQHIRDGSGKLDFSFFFGLALPAMFISLIGFLAGRVAGKAKTPRSAFLWGGLIVFSLVLFVQIIFCLYNFLSRVYSPAFFFTHSEFLLNISLLLFFTINGSLVCGLSAIVVRDYRQMKKIRLLPQFTLQELLIIITLVLLLMSIYASMELIPY